LGRYLLSSKMGTYIVGIVDELFDITSVCMIANQFDEFATRPARCRTSIGKSGVCLLGVNERSTQGLKRIRKESSVVVSE
jgi:hypothetical protein